MTEQSIFERIVSKVSTAVKWHKTEILAGIVIGCLATFVATTVI